MDYRLQADHTDDMIAGPSAAAFAAGCAGLRNRSSPSSAASAMPNSSSRDAHVTAITGRADLVGKELARLALQFQPVAQPAPFAAVGIVDEHRQDARPRAAQTRGRDVEQPAAHRNRDLIGAAGPRRHHEHAIAGRR